MSQWLDCACLQEQFVECLSCRCMCNSPSTAPLLRIIELQNTEWCVLEGTLKITWFTPNPSAMDRDPFH